MLPRMAAEPPAGYVAFVAAHLEPLLRDATTVVGDAGEPDELYPKVLTDVAARWRWLQLRSRLGPADAPDRYLRRAFARRSEHWRADRSAAPGDLMEISVWRPDRPPPAWSNAAARLAPYLPTTVRTEFGPLCEAAIAWLHAYEARRRRQIIACIVGVLVFIAWLWHFQERPDAYALAVALLPRRAGAAYRRPAVGTGGYDSVKRRGSEWR